MNIPMTDLRAQYETIKDDIDKVIKEVMTESGFILGKQLNLFEEEIVRYFKVKYAAGVASGTDALVLSLVALDIGEGDEVITSPFTFIATAEAICRVGANPIFCDIQYDTYNIDPRKIEARITKKTKAILPVHLYGLPCDMDKIMPLANKHNLAVIEDCAQSFGSEYKGRKVGSLGSCGALSFFPAKTLGCYGDGGMVVTQDEAIAQRVKMLRNHGSATKYYYSEHGLNSRLDTLQAAVLRVKLKLIDDWIVKRIENAHHYNKFLSGIAGIQIPEMPDGYKHTFNYYTIRIKDGRAEVQRQLEEKGIHTAVHYPLCLHLQEVYKDFGCSAGDFPVAEQAQQEVLSLPMYPELTKAQIEYICESLKGIF